jgi:glycosyltransferase involved in cell wall biosynthesis
VRQYGSMAVDESAPISRLDGALRRSVADEIWRVWRLEGRGSALLCGVSGTGKSEGIVRPLRDWANDRQIPTVWIDVPLDTVGLDALLLNAMVEELDNGGHVALAKAITEAPTLVAALSALFRGGALVVIDEFQRVLDPQGQPSPALARVLEQLGRRPSDPGLLLLVSNRQVDWSWTESFHVAELPPPGDDADAVRIVVQQLGLDEASLRFPESRRSEVVHRLGRNPRVLRLLGLLLRTRVLAELLPPAETDFAEPVDPRLVEDIERLLLAKAAEGLKATTRAFLRDMSVLRDWAAWDLVKAMSGPDTDVQAQVREARDRYLLQVRGTADDPSIGPGSRYRIHPLLREVDRIHLRQDDTAWRAANRRAGEWYARKLRAAGKTAVHDRTLLFGLDGAWYHFTAAGADDEALAAINPLRRYINHQYGRTAPRPSTDGERDARIALLEVYNGNWGVSGTHYHLAVLLRDRGGSQDLDQAVQSAQRATVGQDEQTPWGLWIKLVRAVEGPEAAVAAAREAAKKVSPKKGLFRVYHLLGLYLSEMHRTREAVDSLCDGTNHVRDNKDRLASLAVKFAAGEPTEDLLNDLLAWLSTRSSDLSEQYILAQALLLEHQNRWADALALFTNGRNQNSRYIEFAVQEALCHLALGDATTAQDSLDKFEGLRHGILNGATWCAAFVALGLGRTGRAADLLDIYLGEKTALRMPDQIRERLLWEWDTIVARSGSPISSVAFPILPPALTGLPTVAIRPQYGGPVLPQHQSPTPAALPDKPHILALATAWSSTAGGVITFNRRLCVSLAAKARVTCVVVDATDDDRHDADAAGVTLVVAPPVAGASDSERLSYPILDGVRPDVIVGHGRWTGSAARRLGVDYPDAARVHILHVIPDDIERHKPPKENVDAATLAEVRQEIDLLHGAAASHIVAVGPRIYDWFRWDLERWEIDPAKLIRFDPGFDPAPGTLRQPPQGRWTVLVTGRMEDHRLKGLDLAARAFNKARLRRRSDTPPIELLVRGASADNGSVLEQQMREWAGDPTLPVRARPYTTRADRLAADLRGASLLLMPSRAEGFGLVAAEAIVAGTPVLVSKESGLGDLLTELEPEEAARIVVPVTGDDDGDVDAWSIAIESALRDRDAEFRRVAALHDRLATTLTWTGASSAMLERLAGSTGYTSR